MLSVNSINCDQYIIRFSKPTYQVNNVSLSVHNSKLGFLVEDVNLAVDQSNLNVIASLCLGCRSNTGGYIGAESRER